MLDLFILNSKPHFLHLNKTGTLLLTYSPTTSISSFIISRPMKIGDQNSLKTPTMIRYIGNNNQKAIIKLRLFASDDLMNWVRVNSLRGRGFKYYKYNIIFEDLLPTDTFSGVTERWQFRYQSKFR